MMLSWKTTTGLHQRSAGPFSYLMDLLPVSGLAVAHLDLEVLSLLPEKEAKLLRMSEQGACAHAGFEGGHSFQY